MDKRSKQCLDYLSKLETAAQDILIDKEQIVEYSRRSNALREAKRALQSEIRINTSGSKTWLCFGNMFIKCPKSKALDIVQKDEDLINEEINNLRDGLKSKVENIRNLEGEPDFKFNLKPLNKNEVAAMRGILPQVM